VTGRISRSVLSPQRVPSLAGSYTPERKDRVDPQQLQLELTDDVSHTPPVTLSAELQEQLVTLMADAIATVLQQDGGHDE